jgi:NAD(P)-dependent dehydrogenase (short-subunit alcohol dehydrogenase family)
MAEGQKFIVITGVTRGLGRAMAEGFIQAGHKLAGCGRSSEELEALSKQHGAPHTFSGVDVTSDSEVKTWAEGLLKAHGTPDILINNAALINQNASLWEVPANEFDRVIDVNIKGVANVIRHFVPAMVGKNRGVIVNFSSGWGRSTSPEVAPYCATKWAMEGLTQALAQELPSGMAAVPLNPGVIDTEMLQSCFGSSAHAYPKPEDWAKNAVPFLLKLSPRQNGQSLSVPGSPLD